MNEVKDYYGYADEDIDYISLVEIRDYVLHNEQYKEILRKAYEDDIEYCRDVYEERVADILHRFYDVISFNEDAQKYGY